ncbi:MAG: peptide ABC transporter substrate-binding protein [Steroidobacteraceae bacterium]|nr:peptide ABC transporter substrate-binding protein [Steroidobacteraceae bacterium]
MTRARPRGGIPTRTAWRLGLAVVALLVLAMLYGLARPGLSGHGVAPTNGSLRIGITQEFESLNPLIAQMSATFYLYSMVNRTLVGLNENTEFTAQLAVQMPTLENGMARFVEVDGVRKLEADWEILPAATWGDGVPVTCRDLQLSWEVAQSPYVSIAAVELYREVEQIRIDPENPKRCTFLYSEPKWLFNRRFQFYLLPDHLERAVFEKYGNQPEGYEKHTLYTTDPTNPGLYHGPYLIREVKLGSHVVFERNPTFYGPPAHIDRIAVVLIPNTGTLEANLRSGSIDMVSTLGMSFDQAIAFSRRVEAESLPFTVHFRPGMVYEHIDLDLDEPVLKDVRVRRALVHAIDRQRLTDALFEGEQPPALHFVAPADRWYTDDPEKLVIYEPSRRKAASLLEEAGWTLRDDGFRYDAAGNRLRLRLSTTAGNKMREVVLVYLQDQWRAIGIDTRIQNEPARIFFGETTRKRRYDGAAMYAWTQSPEAPPRSTLHSADIPTEENGWSGQNQPGWANARVDRLIEELEAEFDPDRRLELIHEIMWHYTSEVPVIPLYYRSNVSVTPANMTGYRLSATQVSETDHVERWNLEPVAQPAARETRP